MIRYTPALLALLLPALACAQPGPPAPGTTPFITNGGSVGRSSSDHFAERINVKDYGAKGDTQSFGAAFSAVSPGNVGNAATIAAGSNALTVTAATTLTAADVGKAITVDGAGTAGAPLSTTIASVSDAQHATLAANAATATPRFQLASCPVVTDQSGGGSYAPGDTSTLSGGTGTAGVCKVQATRVHSATANAAGSGGTDGACVLTGTTGTNASGSGLFQINATITGGAITALGSFVTQGIYTTNPTLLSAEPVTSSCSLTGATLTLVMGVKYAYPSVIGSYSVLPAEPIAQASTSGSGTGATFNPLTNATGGFTYGTDDSAAIKKAINQLNADQAIGMPADLYLPPGSYLIRSTALPIFSGTAGIIGDGQFKSSIIVDAGYSGDVFSWSEAWDAANPFNGATMLLSNQKTGVLISGLSIIGDRTAPAQQNAFMFYDRTDGLHMQNVQVSYLPGRVIYSGATKNATQSWIRESAFINVKAFNDGLPNIPVIEFYAVGGGNGTNDITINNLQMYAPASTGLLIHSDSQSLVCHILADTLRIEGLEGTAGNNSGDLLALGDTTGSGNMCDVQIRNGALIDPYLGSAALHVLNPSGNTNTYGIVFEGAINGGASYGKGLWLSGGRNSSYTFNQIATNDYNIQIDSSTFVGSNNQIISTAFNNLFTTSVDATSSQNQAARLVPIGTGAIRASNNNNVRGASAVDLQGCPANKPTQVASGTQATIGGGCTNTASGNNSTVAGGFGNQATGSVGTIAGGQANTVTGVFGVIPGGFQATDRGAWGARCMASGLFVSQGDAQDCDYILRGTSSNTVAARLTGDGGAAGSNNCVNIPNNTIYTLTIDIATIDHNTPANNETWNGWTGKITRGANAAATAVAMNTTPTPLTSGTVTGSAIAATEDTTNGCLNLSFTPPSGNTDAWRAVAKVRTVQVQ